MKIDRTLTAILNLENEQLFQLRQDVGIVNFWQNSRMVKIFIDACRSCCSFNLCSHLFVKAYLPKHAHFDDTSSYVYSERRCRHGCDITIAN